MSHFTVGVISLSTEDTEAAIERLLAPYSEELSAEEYDRECFCVGVDAENAGEKAADERYGTWDDKKNEFWAMIRRDRPELDNGAFINPELDALWGDYKREFEENRRVLVEEVKKAHPLCGKPKPTCESCDGTGTYKSTYNQNSKWDWYCIGGRWNGKLTETPDNTDGYGGELAENSLSVTTLLERYENTGDLFTFWAVVTPDGAWHEKGEMGWFGLSSNNVEEEAWRDTLLQICRKYPNHNITLIDAHI